MQANGSMTLVRNMSQEMPAWRDASEALSLHLQSRHQRRGAFGGSPYRPFMIKKSSVV